MKLPTEVNILGTPFEVIECGLPPDVCGETDVKVRTIRISSGLLPSLKVETFYHELIHAMVNHLGLDATMTDQQEELLAQGLGMALTYVTAANVLPTLKGSSSDEI